MNERTRGVRSSVCTSRCHQKYNAAMKLPEHITTERLVFRPPRMEDALTIFTGWAQDSEVTRYLTWRPHRAIQETEAFLRECLAAWEQQRRFPYMLTLAENGEVIGMIDPHVEGPRMGIGYVAARKHWGKGYVTEATRIIVKLAFQQPSIYRVYATTDVENVASRRVLEKVGMQCEGILRKYILHPNISTTPRDSYMYAIIKETTEE